MEQAFPKGFDMLEASWSDYEQSKDRAKIEAIQAKHSTRLIGTTLKLLQHPFLKQTKKPIKIDATFIDMITGIKFSKKEKDKESEKDTKSEGQKIIDGENA